MITTGKEKEKMQRKQGAKIMLGLIIVFSMFYNNLYPRNFRRKSSDRTKALESTRNRRNDSPKRAKPSSLPLRNPCR